MLAERPASPTRASRILVWEVASAIGTADCWELGGDADVQPTAANTSGAYMAKTVVHRTHTRLLQVADRLTTGEVGSAALVTVPYTAPAPPPLLAVDNETSQTPRFRQRSRARRGDAQQHVRSHPDRCSEGHVSRVRHLGATNASTFHTLRCTKHTANPGVSHVTQRRDVSVAAVLACGPLRTDPEA